MGRSILFVTDTGVHELGAKIRIALIRPEFERNGWRTMQVDRIPQRYVGLAESSAHVARHRVSLGLGLGRAVGAARRRYARHRDDQIIRMARDADAVMLHKVPALDLLRRLREETAATIMFDYGDPIWLPSTDFGGGDGAFRHILQAAHVVTTDNPFTAARLEEGGSTNVRIVPDPSQVELFDDLRDAHRPDPDKVVLGWVGGPGRLFNLYKVWEALERVSRRDDRVELRILGSGDQPGLLPRFEHVRWSALPRYDPQTMMREVLRMDVGLFPLFDVEEATMRGVLKATVYMAGECCVAASPHGQVPSLIQHGENGLLARTTEEWHDVLQQVVEDAPERRRLAAAGLRTVRERFTIRSVYEAMVAAIDSVEGRPSVLSRGH